MARRKLNQMRVLITGSFRQHNDETFNDALAAAELVGIIPTEIVTGCWVGADQMAKDYAKRNKLKLEMVGLDTLLKLPSNLDAVILVSCFGELDESKKFIKAAEKQNVEIVVW